MTDHEYLQTKLTELHEQLLIPFLTLQERVEIENKIAYFEEHLHNLG